MNKQAKILVTGGLGFIGSNLVDTLLHEGYTNITVVDNLSSESSSSGYRRASVRYQLYNILYIQEQQECQFDIIFHLAANARIQPSFAKPYNTIENNTMGTAVMCEFARKCNAKLIYAGSSSAYAGPKLNPYAFSKWAGEEVILMYHQVYGLNYNIARFFNVYGDRQPLKGEFAPVIGKFMEQHKRGERLTIVGDGNQRRDFTNVHDICQGLLALMSLEKQGIYNLGTGTNYSINEIALAFQEEVIHIPARPGEAEVSLADISNTIRDFNWRPQRNLLNYIKVWKTRLQ